MWARTKHREGEEGFTLLELLVVLIIIAILAAIAIPVFFRQRDKGLVAQSQSALANARILAESYYVGDGDGSYAGLDADALADEGLRESSAVSVVPFPDNQSYCLVAINFGLSTTHEWQISTITSESGTPTPEGDCVGPDG